MKSIAEIKAIRDKMQSEILMRDNSEQDKETRIVVGMATCGISAGARPVFNTLIDEVSTRQLKGVKVSRCGCLGMCKLEPVVEVFVPGKEKVTYVKVDEKKAKEIIESHIINGKVCQDYLLKNE